MRWNDLVFFPGVLIELLGVVVIVAGGVTGSFILLIAGVGIICAGSAATIIRIARRVRRAGSPDTVIPAPPDTVPERPTDSKVLYQDRLVSITGDSITFHNYSFPVFLSDRKVFFRDIIRIEVKRTALGTGKWRIAGSGDLRTWFPMDWNRPSRDRTFFATLRSEWWTIGFTVEDSSRVLFILKEQGLPVVEPGE